MTYKNDVSAKPKITSIRVYICSLGRASILGKHDQWENGGLILNKQKLT